ncbi:MAG: 30S ribosomal protein S17 [Candidatus Gastranaerophilales bacterium]|nr:30S ribosomal protein S17 [Candidatus Gastranaerophilales bacterium]
MPKKQKTGVVISNKNDQTVVVSVPEYRPHPKYKKIIEQNKNYVAADFTNECNEGDKVLIQESKPISKTKRWSVVEIVEKAK